MGEPSLSEITSAMLADFRDCLTKLPGRTNTTRRSPNSVRTALRVVQTLLGKAGPPGPRNRDVQDLIQRVPYARPPREVLREPRFVSEDYVNAAYRAAICLELPRLPGFKPAAWWRALVVTTYNTALRRGTPSRSAWITSAGMKSACRFQPS